MMPETSVIFCGILLIVAVAALVLSEARGWRAGVWLAKPAASTVFVGLAVASGALESVYGRLVLLALVLSWFGDVLLIPKSRGSFLAGLGSFLLAHLAFGAAFLAKPQSALPLVIGAIAMVLVGIGVLRWLWPHLSGALRPAVAAYVGAISLMVALAAGTAGMSRGGLLVVAAVAFAASDVFVARHRFVMPSIVNKAVGLPLYYAAQLAFALSVSAWSVSAG